MPLFTDQIDVARVAYSTLEKRAISAELRAASLNAALNATRVESTEIRQLRQRVADLEGQTIALSNKLDELQHARTDASLQQFIETLALSAAVGEASMPGRAIDTLSASVRAHVTPSANGVALRFHPPELGNVNVSALSTANVAIAKVPPAAGEAAPGNFYGLLLQIQNIFASVDTPHTRDLANKIVAATAQAIADAGGWNFFYLVNVAANLAELQSQLASGDTRPPACALTVRCAELAALAKSMAAKPNPVAGDLYALTAALGQATAAAGLFANLMTSK